MQKFTRMVPLAVALALTAAPVAAPAFAQGSQQGQPSQQSQHPHAMGATSTSHLLSHAYQEALHAHEAAALGMNDMATNHLENVRLTIAMVDPQATGMNQGLAQQITGIRESVQNVDLPTDRAQATQNTQKVVSQFVALFNRTPQAMGGGGGAAQQAAMGPTVFDLTANASIAAANVQAKSSMREWTEAQQHAKDVVSHLDRAIKAAESGTRRLDAKIVTELKNIRQDANRLVTATRDKSQQANQNAGKLVTRLGTVTPQIATAIESRQGGGAGTQQPNQRRHR